MLVWYCSQGLRFSVEFGGGVCAFRSCPSKGVGITRACLTTKINSYSASVPYKLDKLHIQVGPNLPT